jgi:hypothetical protein
VTDHWKGVFKKIYIVCRTARLDGSYVQLREWIEKHLKQDDSESQFIFDHVDEDALMKIFNEQSALVAKEKIQRRLDKSKEPLTSTLYIFDDVSDSSQLRQRNESFLNKVFTTGRHSSQSVWLNIHALTAAGTLLRKNASCLIIFRQSNRKDNDLLADEFSQLIGGRQAFDEVYEAAVGKHSPAYSFLVIKPHEQDVNEQFLARWDKKIVIESDDEEEDTSPVATKARGSVEVFK